MNMHNEIERHAAIYCLLTVANKALSDNKPILKNLKSCTRS